MPDFIEIQNEIINKAHIIKIQCRGYRDEMSYKIYLTNGDTITVNRYDNEDDAKKINQFIKNNL